MIDPSASTPAVSTTPRPRHILLVDESAVERALYRKMLLDSDEPYVLTEVASGEAALELMGGQLPDCMLVDCRLPGLSGVDLLRKLAVLKGEVPVPVVMLTALPDELLSFRAMQAGASTILAKGAVTPRALRSAIDTAIELEIPRRQRILEAEYEYASVAYTGCAKDPTPDELARFAIALELFRMMRAVCTNEPSWIPRGLGVGR